MIYSNFVKQGILTHREGRCEVSLVKEAAYEAKLNLQIHTTSSSSIAPFLGKWLANSWHFPTVSSVPSLGISSATDLLWPWFDGAESQIKGEHSCGKHNHTRTEVPRFMNTSLWKPPLPHPKSQHLLLVAVDIQAAHICGTRLAVYWSPMWELPSCRCFFPSDGQCLGPAAQPSAHQPLRVQSGDTTEACATSISAHRGGFGCQLGNSNRSLPLVWTGVMVKCPVRLSHLLSLAAGRDTDVTLSTMCMHIGSYLKKLRRSCFFQYCISSYSKIGWIWAPVQLRKSEGRPGRERVNNRGNLPMVWEEGLSLERGQPACALTDVPSDAYAVHMREHTNTGYKEAKFLCGADYCFKAPRLHKQLPCWDLLNLFNDAEKNIVPIFLRLCESSRLIDFILLKKTSDTSELKRFLRLPIYICLPLVFHLC